MNNKQLEYVKDWISSFLSGRNDLLSKKYKGQSSHPLFGHCYVASEAMYHICSNNNLKPVSQRFGDIVHWWLVDESGNHWDPTRTQFEPGTKFIGTGRGFLTKKPSKRALVVIEAYYEYHKGS